MDAYPIRGEGRALPGAIAPWVAETCDVEPVYGLAGIEDLGGAIEGGGRVAGFAETHDLREWYVPLGAPRPFRFKTPPVPATNRPAIAFMLSLGFGNGSPLPQSTGQWDIAVNGKHAVSVRVVRHSQLWQQGECRLAFAANRLEAAEPFGSLALSSVITRESFATFGPALLVVPTAWLEAGAEALIEITGRCPVESTRWMQVAALPPILHGTDIYRAVDVLKGTNRAQASGYSVYFGDIHTHSGQVGDGCNAPGCGMGTREENYAYAKGPGGVDFYALTDHEYQFENDADDYFGLAEKHNEDGRFVCLPAFEHTSICYGHRNVYFRGPGGIVVNANREGGGPRMDLSVATTPTELWQALDANGVDAITVPHHPSATSHPLTWDFHNPRYDRLAEVYSVWGSSEYYGDFPRGVSDRYRTLTVRDGLARGYRVGLIASADGHDGHPGNAQSPLVKHHHQFHHLGSGRAAVLVKEFARDAVFEALHDRRCYATTGTPIGLDFRVNGEPMGSELAAMTKRRPELHIACEGTNGIDHIRVMKNGRVVHTEPVYGAFRHALAWEDTAYRAAEAASYYVRVVQVDRESAWSSPVWVG